MFKNRLAVNAAFFVNGFIYANWVSRLPRIQEAYVANDRTIGFVLLCLSLGAVVAMPFAGWVILRNGSRRITLAAAVLYCLFVVIIPSFTHWSASIPLFLTMGAVTGIFDVAMNAQAVIVERDYGKPIMTSFHAFFSIGMALGAWCGALFAGTEYSLNVHFLSIVVLGLICTIWMFRHLVHDKPSKDSLPEGPLFRLPRASLISVGVIAFCCMTGEGAMADWTVNYMENIAGSSEFLAPLALTGFAAAMTVGRIFGDRVRVILGDSMCIVAGGVTASCGLAVMLALPFPYVVIAGCFLTGLGLSTIVPITYSIAGNTKDIPSGVALAMVTTVGYTGFLAGPPIIGFIAEWQTLRIAMTLVAVLFLVMTWLGYSYRARAVDNI